MDFNCKPDPMERILSIITPVNIKKDRYPPFCNRTFYCNYKDLDYPAYGIYKNVELDKDFNQYINQPNATYPFNPAYPHFNIFGDWNKKTKDIINQINLKFM